MPRQAQHQSIELLANAARVLADSAIADFTVNKARLDEALDRNPILVTALNPVIGYEKGAAIAKQAYKEGRAIREVASEETDLGEAKLKELLDPLELTQGGIKGEPIPVVKGKTTNLLLPANAEFMIEGVIKPNSV